jgi:large subunit ribosomal protein L29
LNEELLGLRKEAFSLRMQHSTGQLSGGAQIKSVRRDIARVKTVMAERALGGGE